MARRSACAASHHFVERPRKPGTYECSNCPARFPCSDETCAHVDCVDKRGRRACCECGKEIKGDHIVVLRHGESRCAHVECIPNFNQEVLP